MRSNPLKILVVDDEPDVLEFLTYNLSKDSHVVYQAENGKDAIKIAAEQHPDLIILDIRMPGMTGIEACREIKKNAATNNIAVLFLTADSDEYTTLNAIEAGGNHFVTKPVVPSVLVNMINEIL